MKRAFTLLEVNLAIFIMATGMLGMCALYSFGLRENRQSVEDVAAAAFSDAYLGPLVQGLSATNMAWSTWRQIGDAPSSTEVAARVADGLWPPNGWMDYVDPPLNQNGDRGFAFRVKSGPRAKADGVFGQVLNKVPSEYRGTNPGIPSEYQYALVVTRHGAVVQLAFRVARRKDSLMSQPLFVSEVSFQGDPEK